MISRSQNSRRRDDRLRRAARAAACAVALQWMTASLAAQVRPSASYRELEGEHFRITYGPGLESLAVRALAAAERTHAYLVRTLSVPPRGRIDVVIADDVDFSNGFASPFPSNRVTIYARPPFDDEALSFSPDWIELVVSHEVAHVFHLDRAGRVGRVMRTLFGRMPLIHPMFPAVGTPRWSIEGLAVDVESGYTGLGRLHGSNHAMIVRTALLEHEMERMDRLNEHSPIWPGDLRVYIYGSLFMEYLSERYGEDVQRRLLDKTASSFLPPFLFFDNVAKRTFGESFDDAYAAWRAELGVRYARLADSLSASGLTESERVTTHGRWAIHPRVSRDGRRLAYTAEDGRNVTALRVLDLESERTIESHRRNGLGSHAWTPDGRLVYAQLEFDGAYRILQDLWLEGNGGGRLTDGGRVQDPDVAPDGDRVVAIRNGEGGAGLVMLRLSDPVIRPLATEAGVLWSFPRWSPDGTRVAVGRWHRGGRHDIVVIDTLANVLETVTGGVALNVEPTWSPDGRWILFSSDRSGIANLYAADLAVAGTPRIMQVTNVLTGAFFPEVSPDGRWILFSKYHADGYAIERMPFDTSMWRAPAGTQIVTERASPEAVDGVDASAAAGSSPASRRYNPLRSLAPKYWQPVLYTGSAAGTFMGASTSGQDLVGRHTFVALATVDAEGSGRWEGYLNYANARLGNPVLSVEASRDWSGVASDTLPDGTPFIALERDDAIAGLLTFVRRRWRSSASISIGLERERFTLGAVSARSVRFLDREDRLLNLIARASVATTRSPALAISREDGLSLAIAGKRAVEDDGTVFEDSTGRYPRDYDEVRAVGSLFRSVHTGSFAHHVIAVRASAFLNTGPGSGLQRVGGSSGGVADVLGYGISAGSRLLPVRGFDPGTLGGTRAWTASLEWRAPIALIGRRPAISPFFIDRISLSAFADAGDAWCTPAERDRSATCRRNETAVTPIIGAGAELVFDIGFAGILTGRVRAGAGAPLRGPDRPQHFWIQLGSSF